MKKWILRAGLVLWLMCSIYTLGVSFLPGPQGPQGIRGKEGDTGDRGYRGPRGMRGTTGYTGATGSQGLRGDKGNTWYNDLPTLYKQVSPAVVWIGAEGSYEYWETSDNHYVRDIKWQGTGFFVTPNLIATAGHVVEDTESFEVMFSDGTRAKADFVHMESLDRCDVGFIQLRSEYRKPRPYLDLDTEVEIGEDLVILGYPWGLNNGVALAQGVVSLSNRNIPFFGTKLLIHSDTASYPGNSGSPVVDMDGECVGILIGGRYGCDNWSIVTPAKLVEFAMQKALAEIGLRECH